MPEMSQSKNITRKSDSSPYLPNEFGVCTVYGRCCAWGSNDFTADSDFIRIFMSYCVVEFLK